MNKMNYIITILATATLTLIFSSWYYRPRTLKPEDWNLVAPPENHTTLTFNVDIFNSKRIEVECNDGQLTISDPDYIPPQITH